jgi:hypothetical protein
LGCIGSLVGHRYALRSKEKQILEDSDRLWGKEKLILGNAKRLPGNTDRLSGKTEPESGRTESELGKIQPSSGKEKPVLGNANQLPGNVDWLSGKADPGTEPGPSYGCGLCEELEPTSGKEDNEESVTKKSESGNVGSPIDEEEMELMKECDSVMGGGTIWIDWRLPLLECIRDPRKTTDKIVKQQVLKYTSLDDDLYRITIDDMLLKC